MTPEEFEQLPILDSQRTLYNEPTGYTDFQNAVLPYIDLYHDFLWLLFFGTLFFLMFRFLILPLFPKKEGAKK